MDYYIILKFLLFLSLLYSCCAKEIDVNKVIHTVYTVARDYRNAKIADVSILPKADKLVSRITNISNIFAAKINMTEDDPEAWKSIRRGLYDGFVRLINSCETKDISGYLLGSLKISSSVAAVSGIQGALDAVILETTAFIFEIFGSVFEGKNPTKNTFQEFQDNGISLDFKEAKFYFENLLNPVVRNPSSDDILEMPYERTIDDEQCCQYTENEVIEILRMHQKPIHLYSKLTSLILTYCSNEVIRKTDGNALQRCLTVLKQYCEVSKVHQSFLLRVLSSIKISNLTDNMLYAHKIMYHVKMLFKRDESTLKFLFNPMKSFHMTKVLYDVHLRKLEFKDILDHLAVLDEMRDLYSKNSIILCRQVELKGLCLEMTATMEEKFNGKFWKFQPLKDWTEARSMFIPPRIHVEFMTTEIDVARNKPHSYHGPFRGLAVYSSEDPFDLRNVRISIDLDVSNDPQTRICTGSGWCDTFSDDTKSFKSVHGIDVSQSSLKSVEIPDGIFLKMYTADGSIIPLVGPFSTTDLDKCKVWSWSQIIQIRKVIASSNSVYTSDVLHEVFSPREINLTPDEDISKGSEIQVSTKMKRLTEDDVAKEERSDMMVKVCTKPYLKGFCVQYGSDYAVRGILSTFQRLFQSECKLGMQSMKIPSGLKVIGFQKLNGKFSAFGPYIGPLVIDELDYGAEYQIEVLNLFKNTRTVNNVMKARYRTIKSEGFAVKETNLRKPSSVYDYF